MSAILVVGSISLLSDLSRGEISTSRGTQRDCRTHESAGSLTDANRCNLLAVTSFEN